MTLKNATRRHPLPGKRKLFPTDKESCKGRYAKLTAADVERLRLWAYSDRNAKQQTMFGRRATRKSYSERFLAINLRKAWPLTAAKSRYFVR